MKYSFFSLVQIIATSNPNTPNHTDSNDSSVKSFNSKNQFETKKTQEELKNLKNLEIAAIEREREKNISKESLLSKSIQNLHDDWFKELRRLNNDISNLKEWISENPNSKHLNEKKEELAKAEENKINRKQKFDELASNLNEKLQEVNDKDELLLQKMKEILN